MKQTKTSTIIRHQLPHSTAIEFVAYALLTQTMVVQFRDGGRYAYYNVAPRMYGLLITADSPGAFFNRVIAGQYESELVS